MQARPLSPVAVAAWLAAGAVLVAGAYYPGLHGPFVLDDRPAIVDNQALRIASLAPEALVAAARSGASGALGRPVPYATFAVNHYFAGDGSTFSFKATNLAIHLVNGLVVFALARCLLARFDGRPGGQRRAVPVALLAAGLWAAHPLQLTGVLYVVQRMTSLSALCVLLGLWVFVLGRSRLEEGRRSGYLLMTAGVTAGTALGVLCKENAVLLPALAAVVELTAFNARRLDRPRRRGLALFFGLFLALPAAAAALWVAADPAVVLDAYRARPYDVWQRLLTEPRVLLHYLRWFLLPRTDDLGLAHDDIPVSVSLLSPPTTLAAIAVWLAAAAAALRFRRRAPAAAFAALWFLVGHGLESTAIALEIAYEHRNYLPSAGLAVAGAHYLARLGRARLSRPAARAAAAAGLVLLAAVTHARAGLWSDHGRLVESLVRHHPASPRAHGLAAQYLVERGADPAAVDARLARLAALDAVNVSGLLERTKIARYRRLSGESGLAALEASLANEIRRRLARQPVLPSTVQGLVELKECVRVRFPACAGLGPLALEFLVLAGSSPRATERHRAVLWLHAAMLGQLAGRPSRAIAYMENAVRHVPGDLGFRERQVELHLALGRRDGAAALVRAMAAWPGLTPGDARRIAALRARVAGGADRAGGGA